MQGYPPHRNIYNVHYTHIHTYSIYKETLLTGIYIMYIIHTYSIYKETLLTGIYIMYIIHTYSIYKDTLLYCSQLDIQLIPNIITVMYMLRECIQGNPAFYSCITD